MNTTLIAYHGDPELKARTVEQMKQHRIADTIIKGHYWQDGKGCAVGCLTHDPRGGHDQYPKQFGIPEWLAHLEDKVFEGLPEDQAKLWPERFLSAIQPGADFDGLADRLAIQRLRESLKMAPAWGEERRQQVVDAIEQTIEALKSSEEEARSAAYSAANSAACSAASPAAYSAAYSVFDWADSAANSADLFASASAIESAGWEKEADRIIAELEKLPVSVV